MFSEEFAMLAEYKDSTCITVIMPLQPPSADMRKADMQAAEQMIAKVSDLLREMCPAEESAVLLAGLRELAAMQEADNDPGL